MVVLRHLPRTLRSLTTSSHCSYRIATTVVHATRTASSSEQSKSNKNEDTARYRSSLTRMGVVGEEADAILGDGVQERLRFVRLSVPGKVADEFADCLMFEGALSCSMEDARGGGEGTGVETPVYQLSAGSLAGERAFVCITPDAWESSTNAADAWPIASLLASFDEESEISVAVKAAAEAVGLDESPQYSETFTSSLEWIKNIEHSYKPIQIDESMWIVPRWEAEKGAGANKQHLTADGDVRIILEPGLAFGTGEHPTTRLCLRWLRNASLNSRVLDVGTGSGVLGCAAGLLGAAEVVGTDTDALAVKAAGINARLNQIDDIMTVSLVSSSGEVEDDAELKLKKKMDVGHFDVVIANILLPTVLALCTSLSAACKSPGGRICLSGLLHDQCEEVMEAYASDFEQLRLVKDTKTEWCYIEGVRR